MPGIDILKEWDVKKHGLTGLVVAVLVICIEIFVPIFTTKDPSCENQVKYLQTQNTILVNELISEREKSIQKDTIIKKYQVKDSTWREKVIKPASAIVKKSNK